MPKKIASCFGPPPRKVDWAVYLVRVEHQNGMTVTQVQFPVSLLSKINLFQFIGNISEYRLGRGKQLGK
jgi:hypothetical protein